jgi:hypothetical protein
VVLFGEVDAVGVEICGCRPWVGLWLLFGVWVKIEEQILQA